MKLEDFPRVELAHRPTPLEPLERLSRHLGGPNIFVKRDDCTGLALGGNKTRKLEFLMADAIRQGADTVITVGGLQSNHARQTAAAAAKLGLRCELVLPTLSQWHEEPYETNGNVLLDRLLGATLHLVSSGDEVGRCIERISSRIRGEGGTPYVIPVGGSTAIGALGYVDAARELIQQADERGIRFDAMVITTGSCTTHAGLLVGLEMLHRAEPVIGMTIFRQAPDAVELVKEKAAEAANLLDLDPAGIDNRVEVRGEYLGGGYGQPTEGMIEAVSLAARFEGLLLDPVYTGKTMAGLVDLIRRGELHPKQNVLFWHTGGMPALFAYEQAFAALPVHEAIGTAR